MLNMGSIAHGLGTQNEEKTERTKENLVNRGESYSTEM